MKVLKEMNRPKKTCLYIVLTIFLAVFLLKSSGYYWTPEAVFRACEKGEYLPAAEKIESFPYEEDRVMMLGSSEYGIFVSTAKREYGLWKNTGSYLEYADERYPIRFFYEPKVGILYGTTWVEGASQIYFEARYSEVYEKDLTGTVPLDGNNCFTAEAAPYEHPKGAMTDTEKGGGGFYVELLDEEGTVIWKTDETTHWR